MAIRSLITGWLKRGGSSEPASPASLDSAIEGRSGGSSGQHVPGASFSIDEDLLSRRDDVVLFQERTRNELASAMARNQEAARRAEVLDLREQKVNETELGLAEAYANQERELESVASLSKQDAIEILLDRTRAEAEHQAGLIVKRAEEEARLEADRRARSILAVAAQRLASSQSAEGNTQTVLLPNEEMKGRIIGKEGRNIRALQAVTGVDVIIDETPESVVISSFDPVRREVARLTLEKLIDDGRIHPASCEAAFLEAETEVEDVMSRAAESALLETRITGVHPEVVRLLGKLRFRTSYGQNVLAHVVECSHLAAMMAGETGASVEITRRAALLHDIGKAVGHEMEGTHAKVGGLLVRRYDEVEAVAHAIEAHHNEVQPQTSEAVLVQAADALSGARPGARGNSLEQYVSRLDDLEQIALREPGVKKVHAMQAGREIRVMVDPGQVDDEAAALLSHKIATAIEREMEYPGQVRITVIRELRTTRIAR
ncbi:MAG: ribonuclease Y [Solirubrobacterales bacterium]